jgi:hypothetical protein
MTRVRVKLNSELHPLAGKTPEEMTAILNNTYTSVEELKNAFIVSSEIGPILIWKDSAQNDWVGQPFQVKGGVHILQANGEYAYSPE